MKPERATLAEQFGRSVNASQQRIAARSPGGESSLQQVAAMGAGALHVHHGADRAQAPVAAVLARPGHQAEAQDVLVAELSPLLWHIRYGGQHGFIERAARLFAAWMSFRGRFHALPLEEREGLLLRLASRALHEWLSDRCIACGGSGKLERSRTGAWIRPRGSMQRNATFRVCPACAGSRRQAVSHAQRVQALGMTRERYDAERWDATCTAAITWLNRDLGRMTRPLTVQLERSRKRV